MPHHRQTRLGGFEQFQETGRLDRPGFLRGKLLSLCSSLCLHLAALLLSVRVLLQHLLTLLLKPVMLHLQLLIFFGSPLALLATIQAVTAASCVGEQSCMVTAHLVPIRSSVHTVFRQLADNENA